MSVSARFIQRPIGTTLLAIAILLVGIAVWPLLPVAPLPQVDFPTIQVSASLPGGSPETMASNVAQPLERQFSLIAGLSQMTSQSALGSTQITLQFDLNRNIDAAALDVQAAINASTGQLPTSLPNPPTFRKVNPADSPIMIMSVQSDALPLTQVNDYADNILAQQISQISGVGLVSVHGQQKPAVRIQVDPARLATLGLSLEDIRGAIATTSVNQPKGTVDGAHQSFTVYTNDQLLSAEPWNDMVLAYRHGAPVRVRDIGVAIDAPENNKIAAWAYAGAMAPSDDTLANGRAIVLAITKQPGANVIETVGRIKAAMPRLRAAIPASVRVDTLIDRTQTIRASVGDVEFTLVLSIALVVMVIFVFLRNVAATLIPGITVPLALMGTAGVMYLAGYSLDNLSLMALTIAVGFVVDDAIVMLENIYRHVEAGMTPMQAALKGASEIGFTIISISVSLVAVFIPLLLMGGIVGRLFREFAVTVTLTIAVSVIISLTLTPMLCSRFLKNSHAARHGKPYQLFERFFDILQKGYQRSLDVVMRHQFVTLLTFIGTMAMTVMLFVAIPKGFFPQQDNGVIVGFAESAQDISSQAMQRHLLQVAEIVRKDPDVAGFAMSAGSTTFNTGNFFIALKPTDAGRTASASEIITRLRPQIAGIQGVNLFMQASQDINVGGRLARTQYQYTLTDSNLDELDTWAPKMVERLRRMKQLTDVVSDQQNNAATATITIDRARASSFGISPALIDASIYDAIGQRQVAQYFTQINSYHVVLEVTPALQRDPALFNKLYLTSPLTGQQVPLSTFIEVDTSKTAYLSISHQGQFPAVTISFNLAAGVSLGEAVDAINRAQAEMGVPTTLTGAFQGTAKAFGDSLSSQPYLIAAALIAVYIVLGLLYESYIHPLTILSTLPSAGVGALLILMAGGYDLSVIALIGIILLIGIVKKNGIMMIDFALTAERQQGMKPQAAIYQACLLRFRPIMMTTMCALLSGLPLMLGHGAGSELRRPLGYAMVGGLVLSQALTLFTTPVIYLYLDRAHYWYMGRKKSKHAGMIPAIESDAY
ncbi:efflux RND transporter permease subunit [Verminephrobacter eiseniae]|uniref:Acriflavin resistance protein n=1 Tax=Verminephrobacter eiseniae (strain EF01-2) TaxID=391735 RepID=A1WES8_VEREI|nr:efflux RND transporter permease subunit [Verminephrobacter eiseniae]ABM56135.1 acriflavin resistance protein [Verminephrobacter eiseniae EF01-2]MCW5286505.1 acriflavine resistance protein B [Verminephrobacter eiseniae]MCW5304805.1 acriflavine resistance protein B [Verminephrobacter eiseniae]MCW8178846.1 acriflavine resistance protein B [Verminephrobacter eiseniae]MCW8191038.1 acriflavine resistance protein B [Verminephrobacter eiseniae]